MSRTILSKKINLKLWQFFQRYNCCTHITFFFYSSKYLLCNIYKPKIFFPIIKQNKLGTTVTLRQQTIANSIHYKTKVEHIPSDFGRMTYLGVVAITTELLWYILLLILLPFVLLTFVFKHTNENKQNSMGFYCCEKNIWDKRCATTLGLQFE